jgi:hypothetical protein
MHVNSMDQPGTFTNFRGTRACTLQNDGTSLNLVVDGIQFEGNSMDDYHRNRVRMFDTGAGQVGLETLFIFDKSGFMIDYTLTTTFPNETPKQGEPAPKENLTLRLTGKGINCATILSHDMFEDALMDLHQQLPKGSFMHICFSCAFSDYFFAGSPIFGGILCWLHKREAYLKQQDKDAYIKLFDNSQVGVQETHVCDQFQLRQHQAGYRGPLREQPTK